MSWSRMFAIGLASRVIVVAIGILVAQYSLAPRLNTPWSPADSALNADLHVASRVLLRPWYHWDAARYAAIFREGYTADLSQDRCTVVFLPLLPALMYGASAVGLDPYWTGLVACNLAFAVGLVFLAKIAFRLTGNAGATWRTCLLIIAYPWSYYFSASYGESLGLMFSTAALLAWISDRPATFAASNLVATTARQTTLILPVTIVFQWIQNMARSRPVRPSALLWALAGSLGFLAFLGFCQWYLGDFSLPMKGQSAWGRKSPSLLSLAVALFVPPRGLNLLKDFMATWLFLSLGLRMWIRRGTFWGCLVILPVLQAASTGTVLSMTRLALMAYPAFIEAAEVVNRTWLLVAFLIAGLAIQFVMLGNFVL